MGAINTVMAGLSKLLPRHNVKSSLFCRKLVRPDNSSFKKILLNNLTNYIGYDYYTVSLDE